MDVIENWNFLNNRIKEKNEDMIPPLMQVHMEAFNDLRRSGHLLSVNGKSISEIASTVSPDERLQLIGQIGNSLVKRSQENMFSINMKIDLADNFPNCIFITVAAILENLEGGIELMLNGEKMTITCEYNTVEGADDPLGKLLPILMNVYTWVDIVCKPSVKEPIQQQPKYVDVLKASKIVKVKSVTKIDVMRTVFSGTVMRGKVCVGDILVITDEAGKLLCNEGIAKVIVLNQKTVAEVNERQEIDEILVTVEIPQGTYNGLYLIGKERTEQNKKSNEEAITDDKIAKKENDKNNNGFFTRLFKKK